MLPPGRHEATIHTRTTTDFLLDSFSMLISNTILLVSLAAILGLLLIALMTSRRHTKNRRS